MVFKVTSYMATGVRFALAGPVLACLYRGLGHVAVGLSSIAQWPYLYSWLAVYFHTHGEDLEGTRRPGVISFGNPSLRYFYRGADLRLISTSSGAGVAPIRSWWEHDFFLGGRANDTNFLEELRESPQRLLFARQFGYCQDLPGDLGARAIQREATSLSELVTLWKVSLICPCGQLDLPLPGGPTRDPGTTFAYYTWWKEHMSPRFQQGRLEPTVSAAAGSGEEEEDYDSDRSHPRRRRPKGKKQVSAPSASKKRAPLTALNDASTSASKKKKALVEAQPASLPSLPTFLPPISEIEPHIEPQPSCPSLELDPPETVQISSSPEVSEAPHEELSHPKATVQIDLCVVPTPRGYGGGGDSCGGCPSLDSA
ncbi:hypothetical protein H6P81_002321 [Aristolochia fimbriata]|uniref:Aminotransferase-like plant mobile domain-containing protein n=1 Tax=Aristolochia fimbriata TaxID=158543 RepID=A0AAV7FA50_ARIFI|nr:hypothetical protein H6P81_002321 [Aristolochia fimbriata]